MNALPLSLALAVLLVPTSQAAPVAGSVLVVDDDGGPGVDHLDLSAAVAAAVGGDLILVRDGDYAGVTIDGKSLVVCADEGAVVRLTSRTVVSHVPAGGAVALQGLELLGTTHALRVEDNLGSVLLDDCSLTGMNLLPNTVAHAAVVMRNAAVTFSGCTLRVPQHGDDAHALFAQDSDVHLYASQLEGGPPSSKLSSLPQPGNAAVEVRGGRLVVVDSELTGGRGGNGSSLVPAACEGAAGGPGVLTQPDPSGAAEVVLVDSDIQGGAGGSGALGCAAGPTGPAVESNAGSVQQVPGAVPGFAIDSPVRAGEFAFLTFEGTPGELSATVTNPVANPRLMLGVGGVLVPARAGLVRKLAGVLPASGSLTVKRGAALAKPALFRADFVQSYHAFGPGGLRLGTPRLQVILDPSY